jgi:hypothetical protein
VGTGRATPLPASVLSRPPPEISSQLSHSTPQKLRTKMQMNSSQFDKIEIERTITKRTALRSFFYLEHDTRTTQFVTLRSRAITPQFHTHADHSSKIKCLRIAVSHLPLFHKSSSKLCNIKFLAANSISENSAATMT